MPASQQLSAEVRLEDSQLVTAGQRVEKTLGRVSGGFRRFAGQQTVAAQATQRTTQSFNSFRSPAVQMSYILNDMQQFAFGFSQGIRAISNNLGPLIGTIGLSTKVMGPMILAVEAVSTAIVLLTTRTKQATDQIKNFASQIIKVQKPQEFFEFSAKAAALAAEKLTQKIKQQEQTIKGFQGAAIVGSAAYDKMGLSAKEATERLNEATQSVKRLSPLRDELRAQADAALAMEEAIKELSEAGYRPTSERAKKLAEVLANLSGRMKPLKSEFQDIAQILSESGPDWEKYQMRLFAISQRVSTFRATIKDLRGAGSKPPLAKLLEIDPTTQEALFVAGSAVDAMAQGFGQLAIGARSFGEVASGVFKQVIADITAAIAKMAILKGLLAFTGGGGLFGSILSTLATGTPGFRQAAPAAPSRPQVVGIVRGPDLQLITRENARRVGG